MLYDRAQLLKTLSYLDEGLGWVRLARDDREMEERGDQHDIQALALLHSELCYASTRVRVKLAATVPPPGSCTQCLYVRVYTVVHVCLSQIFEFS